MLKQIIIAFFFLVVLAFTGFSVYRMYKPKSARFTKKRAFVSLLFLWYLCGVAAMTIVPIRESYTQNLQNHFNFKPVINTYHRYFYVTRAQDVDGLRNYYENLLGNILLFIPMGIFLPLLYNYRFRRVLVIGALSSIFIEFMQFINMHWGYYRYVDVDDVILNTLGAIIGYWFYKTFLHDRRFTRL